MRRIGIFSQLAPPKPTWTAEKVPDQTGKVVIITGGNRGIGLETARVLLVKGARVYVATRSSEKGQTAVEELKAATGKDSVFLLTLDLGDLNSIKAAAEEFLGKESELHTLYNSGGLTYAPTDRVTNQGIDVQFGTNVLGHFYLTKLLLPVLIATAKKSPQGTVRVVNVSSIIHYMAAPEGIRWSTLEKGEGALQARKKFGMARLNAQSRLGNILFSNELARRYGGEGIVSISLFPGALNVDLSGYAGSFINRVRRMLSAIVCFIVSGGDLEALTEDVGHDGRPSSSRPTTSSAPPPPTRRDSPSPTRRDSPSPTRQDRQVERVMAAHGHLFELSRASFRAITSLYAGTEPAAGQLNGNYLTAWARPSLPHRKALNEELAGKLWTWCEEQVKDPKEKEKESEKEPAKEPGQEPAKEPGQELAKEPGQEPAKEPGQEPAKEPGQEPAKELGQESVKELGQEPAKEPAKEPEQEPTKESGQEQA